MLQKSEEYLKANPNFGKVLFYPGSGSDYSPLDLFINNSSINTIIYIDYEASRGEVVEMLRKIKDWDIDDVDLGPENEIYPEDFNKKNWAEFWPNNKKSIEYANPDSAFAIKTLLQNRDTGNTKEFIFFKTEAIQTYSILKDNGYVPDVIVLQNHGMGSQWSPFDGDSLLYQAAKNSLPKYIYIAETPDMEPWPNYTQVTEYEIRKPAQHKRAIFTLNH